MTNVLKESVDNIFVTSANVLDKLTYKLTPAATETVTPHNNASLLAPLTAVLRKDFQVYNQLLDEFNIELQDAEHALNYLKLKNLKEAELQLKMQEEAKVRKQNEAAASQAKLQEQQKIKVKDPTPTIDFGTNTDDLMLDLDLDNFNFGQDDQTNDLLNFDDGSIIDSVTTTTSHAREPASSTSSKRKPVPAPLSKLPQAPPPAKTSSSRSQSQTGQTGQTGQDLNLLDNLNLDFMDAGVDTNTNDDDLMLPGLESGNASAAANNEFDDGSLMPPDQMEHLFSQFDELVGGGGGGNI